MSIKSNKNFNHDFKIYTQEMYAHFFHIDDALFTFKNNITDNL